MGGGPAEEVLVVAGKGLGRFDAPCVVFQAKWDGEGEVGARAEAGEGDLGGVEAEDFVVGGEIEEGVDGVIDGGWEGVLGCQAVAHAHKNGRHVAGYAGGPIPVVEGCSEAEAAAVEIDDDGVLVAFKDAAVVIFWGVEVERNWSRAGRECWNVFDKGGFGRPGGSDIVEEHAQAHEEAPCSCLGEQPFARGRCDGGEVVRVATWTWFKAAGGRLEGVRPRGLEEVDLGLL